MEGPRSLRRWQPAVWMTMGASLALGGFARSQPPASQPRLHVSFPGNTADQKKLSAAVPLGEDSLWVTVVAPGADASHPVPKPIAAGTKIEFVGHDPVSTLAFLRVSGPAGRETEWLDRVASGSGQTLYATGPTGTVKFQTNGWVQQFNRKILPFALLRVGFDQNPPPPGSAMMDEQGRVAAVYFQNAGSGNTGYAIPAEAVHRVRRDVCQKGRLVRGWIGLSLQAENAAPQVVRVLPDSPAQKAGIHANDVLTQVGGRAVSSYPDAANAFFYLIPGDPVRVKILRGATPMEFTLTPVPPQEG